VYVILQTGHVNWNTPLQRNLSTLLIEILSPRWYWIVFFVLNATRKIGTPTRGKVTLFDLWLTLPDFSWCFILLGCQLRINSKGNDYFYFVFYNSDKTLVVQCGHNLRSKVHHWISWNGCYRNPVQLVRSHVPDFIQIIISPIPVQPNGSAYLDGRRFEASPSHILSITHTTNKILL
jgi:hypothetical protein